MDERKEPPVAASGPSTAPADRPGWDISVCGLNCAKCKLLEQDRCAGCRGPLDRHWSPDCQFRACAEAKDHGYCFECADFPCQKLRAFAADGHEHHRLTVENMKKMKELGLEKWLARQPRPMFCPGWKF
jgi:predicted amidophosphoribosyltransferase